MIRRLAPILGITFIDILGFSMLIPLLPYFVTHFHASPFVVGVLFSTFSFCQLISGPIWGNISDRIGRKGVLIISQIGATIGWGMLGAAGSVPMIFIARIIEGCSGGNIGVTQAYVADLVEPKERSKAFGYISATFAAGMIFGPLAESLLFNKFGYGAPFYAAAGLQFLTLLATIVFLPESRSKSTETTVVGPAEIMKTFRNKKLSPLLWQKLALSLCLYAWFGVMALYLQHQLHFGPAQTGYYFASFGGLNVLVNGLLVGRVTHSVGDRNMSTIGLFALVVAFALVPFIQTLWQLVVMGIAFSFGIALSNTGLTAIISNAVDGRRQGTVLSVTSSLDSISGIVSPPISTGVLGAYGSAWAGAYSLFFALIAFLAGLWQGRREVASAHKAVAETA